MLWVSGCAHYTRNVSPAESKGPPVSVQFERAHYQLQADGTQNYTYSVAYRVQRVEDLGLWGGVEALWGPWIQAPPRIEVKIIHPDGSEVVVDPEEFERGPIDAHDGDSRMRIFGRLPLLQPGSLVEQHIFYKGLRPRVTGFADGRFYFGTRAPVAHSELVVETPEAVPLQTVVRGLKIQPLETKAGGQRVLHFALKNVPPRNALEANLPRETPRFPYVGFSTAVDWASIAQSLSKRFSRRLRYAELNELVEGIVGGHATTQIISEVIARVHSRVRFTGRYFGAGPLIPLHPEETLARTEGDGEDIALLVVAALGALGIDAEIALMCSAPDEDVRPELPGVTAFDRAVVRVRSDSSFLWLDPLEVYYPVGYLPPSLEGRWALPINLSTNQLVRTPTLGLAENQYVGHRRLILPNYGRLGIQEKSWAKGALGAHLRAQLSSQDKTDGYIQRYTSSQLGSSKVVEIHRDVPRDLSKPSKFNVEVENSWFGTTDIHSAFVDLRATSLFGWLPLAVREAVAFPESAGVQNVAFQRLARRTQPFVLSTPYTAELNYEVIPPSGFRLVERPKDQYHSWGPAEFSVKYHEAKGVLFGTFRFATGAAVYRPKDMVALVRGLQKLSHQPAARVRFYHQYSRELAKGNTSDALVGYAKVAAQAPQSAEHQARLALALVEIGLGSVARDVVRKAAAKPSVLAQYALGRVLSHDMVGRLHSPGYDREGAIRAFSNVKLMEPQHIRARVELANLLAIDRSGLQHQDPLLLEAAAVEYRSLREDTGISAFDEALANVLFQAGRIEESLSVVETAPRSVGRDTLMVAARVALDGHIEGVDSLLSTLGIASGDTDREISTSAAKEFVTILHGATSILASTGRYALAAEVWEHRFADGELVGQEPPHLVRLRSIKPFGELLSSSTGPVRVVQRLIAPLLEGRAFEVDDLELLSKEWSVERREAEIARMSKMFGAVRRSAHRARMTPAVLRDDVMSRLKYEVTESSARRVRVRAVLGDDRVTVWFLRKYADNSYRVIATGRSFKGLAELALHALRAKDLAAADEWLRWTSELFTHSEPVPSEELDFSQLPFVRLVGKYPHEREAAIWALGMMSPGETTDRNYLRGLDKKIAETPSGDLRDTLRHALLVGLVVHNKWQLALPLVEVLASRYPTNFVLYQLRVAGQSALERWSQAESSVQSWMLQHPQDTAAGTQLANLRTAQGRFAEAEDLLEALAKAKPEASSMVYNDLAWVSLLRGDVGKADLSLARKAYTMDEGKNPVTLHTLAALYAEKGDAKKTISLLRQRLDLLRTEKPLNVDYYLMGRLLECLGLTQLAQDAYLKVRNDDGNRQDSTYILAQRRLRRLGS